MMSRKTLFTSLALGLALSAPAAFAQDATQGQDPATAPTAPTTTSPTGVPPGSDPATAQQQPSTTGAQQPTGAAPGAEAPQRVTWSDLDTDKDGKLTKAEAAPVQALTQVFDDADTDKDGALTPDEYKAFVAKNQEGAAAPPQG